jgi:2-polyprenyl-3-methyl-5-hydroxy-6-metoxy-1,4-benzoquinol methylase
MADGQKTRLLVVMASFGTSQDRYLEPVVQNYRKMKYDVDVVIVSNVQKPVPAGVELVVGLPTKDPWSLPFAHKKVMAERAEKYDLFIYSEGDTMVFEKNIDAFLRVSEALPETEIPGFLLYENSPLGVRRYAGAHTRFHWDPASVCARGPYTFAYFTNEHAACYLITKKQLQHAIASGNFLVAPYRDKYDMACTASTDPYTRCGYRKLICISHLEDFVVHHTPDKYTPASFTVREQEFEKQIKALLALGRNGTNVRSLLPTETRLWDCAHSKEYYEAVREEVVREIPESVRTVLSLGAGTGRTEEWLINKGVQVTAVPLDPVIGACLEGTGVEIVNGNLRGVREKLAGRRFDCLYLSNILHLMENPETTLKRFVELLNPGGCVLVVTPNVANLKEKIYRVRGKPGFENVGNYERGGAHNVSRRILEEWFRGAGCRVERVNWVVPPKFTRITWLFPKLFNGMFGSEIIALARKAR